MPDCDVEVAVRKLARAIAQCLETVGPDCTARLLGETALDLARANGRDA